MLVGWDILGRIFEWIPSGISSGEFVTKSFEVLMGVYSVYYSNPQKDGKVKYHYISTVDL